MRSTEARRKLKLLVGAGIAVICLCSVVQAADYYVDAVNGSDGGSGSSAAPFRTISRGIQAAHSGDTVYVRGGVYHEMIRLNKSGVRVTNQAGHSPVIDGRDTLPPCSGGGRCTDGFVNISGSNNSFNGFEVRGSRAIGILLMGSHNTVSSCNAHHNKANGIYVYEAERSLVENCRIWQNVQNNVNGSTPYGVWGQGLTTNQSVYTTFKDCEVFNNWGEGIGAYRQNTNAGQGNVVVKGCKAYDNWRVNLYVDQSPWVTLDGNIAGHTGDQVWHFAPAIAYCDESQLRTHDVQIINNITLGGMGGFYHFKQVSGDGLRRFLIANNTFVNTTSQDLFIAVGGGHSGSRVVNNIFIQENSRGIARVGTSEGLTFSNNLWSRTPPAVVRGPGDIIGDPHLAGISPGEPDAFCPDQFKLTERSPARTAGIDISGIAQTAWRWDFEGKVRLQDGRCDMGAFAFGPGGPPPTPTPVVAPPLPPRGVILQEDQ